LGRWTSFGVFASASWGNSLIYARTLSTEFICYGIDIKQRTNCSVQKIKRHKSWKTNWTIVLENKTLCWKFISKLHTQKSERERERHYSSFYFTNHVCQLTQQWGESWNVGNSNHCENCDTIEFSSEIQQQMSERVIQMLLFDVFSQQFEKVYLTIIRTQ
jgi:hypothetical protein